MLKNASVVVIIIIVALILYFVGTSKGSDNFVSIGKKVDGSCKIDEDCPQGEFCYMGKCWGYWRGNAMPWSTCRNPYCGCTEPGCDCDATGQGGCLPYCKCTLNRRPGGSISKNCFPKCGTACLSNDDCPPGCPQCNHGICSAPEACKPIF